MTSRRKSPRSGRAAVSKQITRALNKRERVQAEWMPLRTWHCETQMFVPDGECPGAPAQLGLWDPEERSTTGQTAGNSAGALIHRIVGKLYFLVRFRAGDPLVPAGTDLSGLATLYANIQTMLRVGLMKQRAEVALSGIESLLTWNPLMGFFDPTGAFSAGDWTDGRWIRQWEKHFTSQYELGYGFDAETCCPNVSGSISGVSPGVTSGTIETNCEVPCNPIQEGSLYFQTPYGLGPLPRINARWPGWWEVNIDIRTKMRMEETDRLDLWCGWYNGREIGLDPVAQPRLHVKGDVRALVSRP